MTVSTGRFVTASTDARVVVPVSTTARWTRVRTGVASSDNGGSAIDNPDSQITASTALVLSRGGDAGTLLRLRYGRPSAKSVTGTLTVNVFGRTGSDVWQRLYNKAGNTTVEISLTDSVIEGSNTYAASDASVQTWDCDGCDEILVGLVGVPTGEGATDGFIEGKCI